MKCVPATLLEAMNLGMQSLGLDACHKIAIAVELSDSNPLFFTGNTDTVYAAERPAVPPAGGGDRAGRRRRASSVDGALVS